MGQKVDEEEEEAEEEMGSYLEGMAPAPKRHKLANNSAITGSFQLGLNLEFLGVHGPSPYLKPNYNSALDYLLLLWLASLAT